MNNYDELLSFLNDFKDRLNELPEKISSLITAKLNNNINQNSIKQDFNKNMIYNSDFFSDIENYIMQNKIEIAFLKLQDFFSNCKPDDKFLQIELNDYRKQFILLFNRFNSLKEKINNNLVSHNELNIENNQIVNSLVNFTHSLSSNSKLTNLLKPHQKTAINENEIINISAKILPLFFIVDTSGSMSGEPIEQIKNIFRLIKRTLEINYLTKFQALITLISFDTNTNIYNKFTDILDFNIPDFKTNGSSNLGEALQVLGKIIASENQYIYKDFYPLIFIMTDGQPTDDWRKGFDNFIHKSDFSFSSKRICFSIGSHFDFLTKIGETHLADLSKPLNTIKIIENTINNLMTNDK